MDDKNLNALLAETAKKLTLCVKHMNNPKHPLYLSRKAGMIARALDMLREAMELK